MLKCTAWPITAASDIPPKTKIWARLKSGGQWHQFWSIGSNATCSVPFDNKVYPFFPPYDYWHPLVSADGTEYAQPDIPVAPPPPPTKYGVRKTDKTAAILAKFQMEIDGLKVENHGLKLRLKMIKDSFTADLDGPPHDSGHVDEYGITPAGNGTHL